MIHEYVEKQTRQRRAGASPRKRRRVLKGRKRINQLGYLFTQEVGRTIIQQDKIYQLYFLRQRQLHGNSGTGERRRESALLKPRKLHGGMRRDTDGEIKPILEAFFKEQGYLHHP